MLAGMAATLALRPTPLASKRQQRIERLANRKKQTHPGPHRRTQPGRSPRSGRHLREQQHQTHLNMLNRHRRAIDTKIQELIAAEPTLARKAEIIASVPGLASKAAANLLAEMPELGTLRNPAAVSLAGLAPIARESGAWQGRRFIQGGRHPVRRLLYMPALAAIRCNPDMKQTYRTLAERGKPSPWQGRGRGHHAQTPGNLANVLIKQDRLWKLPNDPRLTPNKPSATAPCPCHHPNTLRRNPTGQAPKGQTTHPSQLAHPYLWLPMLDNMDTPRAGRPRYQALPPTPLSCRPLRPYKPGHSVLVIHIDDRIRIARHRLKHVSRQALVVLDEARKFARRLAQLR